MTQGTSTSLRGKSVAVLAALALVGVGVVLMRPGTDSTSKHGEHIVLLSAGWGDATPPTIHYTAPGERQVKVVRQPAGPWQWHYQPQYIKGYRYVVSVSSFEGGSGRTWCEVSMDGDVVAGDPVSDKPFNESSVPGLTECAARVP